jgi:hypothetical protein
MLDLLITVRARGGNTRASIDGSEGGNPSRLSSPRSSRSGTVLHNRDEQVDGRLALTGRVGREREADRGTASLPCGRRQRPRQLPRTSKRDNRKQPARTPPPARPPTGPAPAYR